MVTGFIVFTDECHQIRRILEGIRRTVVMPHAAGRITVKGQYRAHSRLGIPIQNVPYFLPAVPYAGEVGYRRNPGFILDAQDDFTR